MDRIRCLVLLYALMICVYADVLTIDSANEYFATGIHGENKIPQIYVADFRERAINLFKPPGNAFGYTVLPGSSRACICYRVVEANSLEQSVFCLQPTNIATADIINRTTQLDSAIFAVLSDKPLFLAYSSNPPAGTYSAVSRQDKALWVMPIDDPISPLQVGPMLDDGNLFPVLELGTDYALRIIDVGKGLTVSRYVLTQKAYEINSGLSRNSWILKFRSGPESAQFAHATVENDRLNVSKFFSLYERDFMEVSMGGERICWIEDDSIYWCRYVLEDGKLKVKHPIKYVPIERGEREQIKVNSSGSGVVVANMDSISYLDFNNPEELISIEY